MLRKVLSILSVLIVLSCLGTGMQNTNSHTQTIQIFNERFAGIKVIGPGVIRRIGTGGSACIPLTGSTSSFYLLIEEHVGGNQAAYTPELDSFRSWILNLGTCYNLSIDVMSLVPGERCKR